MPDYDVKVKEGLNSHFRMLTGKGRCLPEQLCRQKKVALKQIYIRATGTEQGQGNGLQ